MTMDARIKIQRVETLSDDWYVLKKTTFDFQLQHLQLSGRMG